MRSPHAHARFRITDADSARKMPGVHLVLTGDDIKELGTLPCHGADPRSEDGGRRPIRSSRTALSRHVGDAIAFIVADTDDAARDAAEAIVVEWTQLPHVVDGAAALEPGAPPVWDNRPGNLAFETTLGDKAATDAAFAKAARVAEITLVNQRLVTNYLDTRAVVAEYDAGDERYTLTLGSQGSHARARHHRQARAEDLRRRRCGSSRPMSAAASAPSFFPIANMRSRRSRRSARASR